MQSIPEESYPISPLSSPASSRRTFSSPPPSPVPQGHSPLTSPNFKSHQEYLPKRVIGRRRSFNIAFTSVPRNVSFGTDITGVTNISSFSSILPASNDAFYRTPTESARRWWKLIIRKYGTKSDGTLKAAAVILEEVDQRLWGDVASWANKNPIIKKLLTEENFSSVTHETLKEFKEHFLRCFKLEEPEEIKLYQAIESLKQQEEETINDYYRRSLSLLKELSGVNDAKEDNKIARSLLKIVVTKFITGLAEPLLQTRIAGYTINTDYTLKGAYTKIQSEARKIQVQ